MGPEYYRQQRIKAYRERFDEADGEWREAGRELYQSISECIRTCDKWLAMEKECRIHCRKPIGSRSLDKRIQKILEYEKAIKMEVSENEM